MNRTGLITALIVAVAAGLLFGLYPALDLRISALFFDPETKQFMIHSAALGILREAAMWVVTALAAPAFIALALKLLCPRRRMLMAGRAMVFLIATIALAPGLATNVVLKDYWPRSRPIDVPQFNGQERFTAWWDPRGGCEKNCSFVGGESSGAFWSLAPAALSPPAWRPAAYAAAIIFGLGTGLVRMSAGAHFCSDIVFSGDFTFLIVWLVHGLIYRWRPTRFSDQAVERILERLALPPHDAVMAAFAGLFRRGRS
jgi:membrane-associated PAP2 superfamily phosphatase